MMIGLWGMSFSSSRKAKVNAATSPTGIPNEDTLAVIESTNELAEPLLVETNSSPMNGNPTVDGPTTTNDDDEDGSSTLYNHNNNNTSTSDTTVQLGCGRWDRRMVGLVCACFDGLWGGSILVPMHYAKKNAEGLDYLISFSTGAVTVLILLWIVRIAYGTVQTGSARQAIVALPSLHLSVMWLPGGIAGLLWSIGNLASILSVQYLGEGVGYSIVQAQMIVAGLWGVLWYKEVGGWRDILVWMVFSFVTLGGIILLSYEHQRN